jgi:hypothetical protein
MAEESIYPTRPKLPTAKRILNVLIATSSVQQDTEEDEHGERICCKICSHTVVHTQSAKVSNSSFAADGSGLSMKLAIVKPGDVQNMLQPYIKPRLD